MRANHPDIERSAACYGRFLGREVVLEP